MRKYLVLFPSLLLAFVNAVKGSFALLAIKYPTPEWSQFECPTLFLYFQLQYALYLFVA